MNKLDKRYTELLEHILVKGIEKDDRTGTGTISTFGNIIRHDMSEGFPILTTKKMAWKQIVTELLWFLRGETNIQSLVQQDNYIWVGDAYKKYQQTYDSDTFGVLDALSKSQFIEKIKTDDKFAKEWGELGPIYGKQWRDWDGHDQIKQMIWKLRNKPDDRRNIVSAWNVPLIDSMTLPPCHYSFQVWTAKLTSNERFDYYFKNHKPNRDVVEYIDDLDIEDQHKYLDDCNVPKRKISLLWNQRSVDTFLGLAFNISSYGLLLEILAKCANMVPYELIGMLGDTHLYNNHLDQAQEQIDRLEDSYELPKLNIIGDPELMRGPEPNFQHIEDPGLLGNIHWECFQLENYNYMPAIKAPLSN